MRIFALPVLAAFSAFGLAACQSEPATTPAVADPDAQSMDMSSVDTEGSSEEVAPPPMPGAAPGVIVTDENGNTLRVGPDGSAVMTSEEIDARFGAEGVKVDTTGDR